MSLGGRDFIRERQFVSNVEDYLRFRLPAGGGYGDLSERDPDLVAADVLNGLVSRKAAKSVYKVVLNTKAESYILSKRKRPEGAL